MLLPRCVWEGRGAAWEAELPALGEKELPQAYVLQSPVSCHGRVCGEGAVCSICAAGCEWSSLKDYRGLLVGSVYFTFSHLDGASEESSLQALSWR